MNALLEWLTANANAISGYVVLLVVVIVFFVAINKGWLYMGKGVNTMIAELQECRDKLEACQREQP